MTLLTAYALVLAISLLILLLLVVHGVIDAVLGTPAIGAFVGLRASEAELAHGWAIDAYTHHQSGLYALAVADLDARLWAVLYQQVAHYQEPACQEPEVIDEQEW